MSTQALTTGYYMVNGVKYYYNAVINQWYIPQGTLLIPLAIAPTAWPPNSPQIWPNPQTVAVGGRVDVAITYQHLGPASSSYVLHAALGIWGSSFSEAAGGTADKNLNIVQHTTVTMLTDTITLTVPSALAGHAVDLYYKISSSVLDEKFSPVYTHVLDVLSSSALFTDLTVVSITKQT